MHAMTYDANGGHHSPMELAVDAVGKARAAGLPMHQVTIGLPFYGRNSVSGDWVTYEDLVQRHAPLDPALDRLPVPGGPADAFIGLNGRATIAAKTQLAVQEGLGGVMIWEAGQDCRMVPVTHGDKTHGVTCPEGERSSLLVAMREAWVRARSPAEAAGEDVSSSDL